MKRANMIFFLFLFLLVINSSFIFALEDFDVSISNSANWEDVYSTMLFSGLNNADAEFLVSTAHGSTLLNGISKDKNLLLVSSKSDSFVFNYISTIKLNGFTNANEIEVDSANLDLIKELPNIKNFIVVENNYGYNAIAVAPYALLTNSWVFLANRANIDEINAILSNRDVESVLIYGYVDREVSDTLQSYSPETIFTGDKFKDNIKIVKKFLEKKQTKQVVLTNGEYLEKEIMLGGNPVLFTGRENVPEEIKEYFKSSDIEIGVLIGNELVGAATNIKRSTGISVIAKFARGSRSPSQGVSAVEGLDLFYLPSPRLNMTLVSVRYNIAMKQLELTYKSNSNVPAYFKGTVEINYNGDVLRLGDLESIFIAPGAFKTIVYTDVDLTPQEGLSSKIYTLFGEVKTSLDRILDVEQDIDFINVLDSSELVIVKLIYNKQAKSFFVKVKNIGNIDTWVEVELKDVLINNIKTNLGSKEPVLVKAGHSKNIKLEQLMDIYDLEDNSFVESFAYYGQKKDSLVKLEKANFEIIIQRFTTSTIVIIVLIILIFLLIFFWFLIRRKDKDDDFW